MRRIAASIRLETKRREAVLIMLPRLATSLYRLSTKLLLRAQANQRQWHLCSGGCVVLDSRKSRMTNQKVDGRGDRTDWTSRRVSFR